MVCGMSQRVLVLGSGAIECNVWADPTRSPCVSSHSSLIPAPTPSSESALRADSGFHRQETKQRGDALRVVVELRKISGAASGFTVVV